MKFVFVAEAGFSVGMGHLRRSLALANSIKRLGADVYLNTSRVDARIRSQLTEQTSVPVQNSFPKDGGWNIVLDGYKINPADYKLSSGKVHLITDYQHMNFAVDTLIDPNFDKKYFPNRKGLSFSELYSGPEYVILADRYDNEVKAKKFVSVPKLLVTLGGSDPKNHTERVLRKLLPYKEWFSEVGVVVGPMTKKLSEGIIKAWAGYLRIHVAPKHLADLYAYYDVAIGAGGTSAYERVNRNMPSINLVTHDNQNRVSKSLDDSNLGKSLDARVRDFEITQTSLRFLLDKGATSKVRERGNIEIDGQGSDRLAKLLVGEGI